MLSRIVRGSLAALVAGGLVFAGSACGRADTLSSRQPAVILTSQSATVTPSSPGAPASFAISFKVPGAPSGARVQLMIYRALGSRSAFEATLNAAPSSTPLSTVGPVPLASLSSAPAGGVGLDVQVLEDEPVAPGGAGVDLQCTVGNGSCSGVYPIVIDIQDAQGTSVARLTTYLTYAEQRSASPLVFCWVVPISAPPAPGGVTPGLSPGRLRTLVALASLLLAHPEVQTSIALDPSTVEALEQDHSRGARGALSMIRALAESQPARLLAEPFVDIDLGGLSAAGVGTEIVGQMLRGRAVTAGLLGMPPTAALPSPSPWVASGPLSDGIVHGLELAGSTGLVLPQADLANATEEAHATWAQPFTLSTPRGDVDQALQSDTQLSQEMAGSGRDPVLAANQVLADLAMIHFELPGASQRRGVLAVSPSSWSASSNFVNTVLSGLSNDPVVTSATISQLLSTVPKGGNDAASTRRLAGPEPKPLASQEVRAMVSARERVSGFDAAANGASALKSSLGDQLLRAESASLSSARQQAALAGLEKNLGAELGHVRVLHSTVTLTARTGTIPITILSSARYRLRATLTLSSAKLVFPQGPSRTVAIDHPTNSTDFLVKARTSGDLPLSYTLTSPGGLLVLARGQLTVRSTATSIAGIALTLLAIAVLSGWWLRTWLRSRRRRRARRAAAQG
ncbi:MAG: hypothetical protein ACRDVP_06510 [Acidimicrobiales bacterium]